MIVHSKRRTPVPRPIERTTIKTELERAEKSLVTRKITPEEMEEIYQKYGRPTMKLKDRRGFGGGAA